MKILIDTREQNPYTFSGIEGAEPMRGTLETGDYSLPGLTDRVAVERKALDDAISCLGRDRERFFRELDRLRGFESAALVIEATWEMVASGWYRSRLDPGAAAQSLISIQQEYRLPIFFAMDRRTGEHYVFHFLRHFAEHTARRCRAAAAALS